MGITSNKWSQPKNKSKILIIKHYSKIVKLWFTTMYLVGFYSVPNLIVILFNLLYPIFIVWFDCKGCVIRHATNHKWLLRCTCLDEHLLVICSLESFFNDCPCLIKCLFAWYLLFTYLIALCLLMFIPCIQLVINLMKVLFVCKCFRLQV